MSIVVQNVTKFYGGQKALDNVSFKIRSGEIAGFLGPNGAGKSTMMKIITGFIPASSGSVKVNGMDIGEDGREIKKITGYLPENNPLYPEMYVREYLRFVASFYRSGRPLSKGVDKVIDVTGLGPEQNKKIRSLSKGYRQRVGLAQALINNPGVLILDEATTGLDPNQIVEIRNLIREAGREKTVMLSTHIMQEVEAICDRVIIIDKGVIVADEAKENIHSKLNNANQTVEVEFGEEVDEALLEKIPFVRTVKRVKDRILIIEAAGDQDIRPALFSFAVNKGITVLSLQRKESNLEEIFRQLTGKS